MGNSIRRFKFDDGLVALVEVQSMVLHGGGGFGFKLISVCFQMDGRESIWTPDNLIDMNNNNNNNTINNNNSNTNNSNNSSMSVEEAEEGAPSGGGGPAEAMEDQDDQN